MRFERPIGGALAGAVVASILAWAALSSAQVNPDPNAAPNPYRLDEGWAKLPAGRNWGAAFGIVVDRSDGKSMWAFDRCEKQTLCGSSHLGADLQFRPHRQGDRQFRRRHVRLAARSVRRPLWERLGDRSTASGTARAIRSGSSARTGSS